MTHDYPPLPPEVEENPDLVPLRDDERWLHQKRYPEKYLSLKDIPDPPHSDLPDWLSSNPLDPEPKPLPLTAYANMFEWVCERISIGETLGTVLNRDPRNPDVGRFIRWVMKDEGRREKYYEAQAIGAEVMFEEDMIRIADADDSLEDVQRTKVKLDTRWKRLAICNRKRFGDVKQIEQNINIDLAEAMKAADERLKTVEMKKVGDRYE